MTLRQKAIHTVTAALGNFPPAFTEDLAKSIGSLKIIFHRRGKNTDEEPYFQQLQDGVVQLLISASTSLLSEKSREKWFAGLATDAEQIDPQFCHTIRKYFR